MPPLLHTTPLTINAGSKESSCATMTGVHERRSAREKIGRCMRLGAVGNSCLQQYKTPEAETPPLLCLRWFPARLLALRRIFKLNMAPYALLQLILAAAVVAQSYVNASASTIPTATVVNGSFVTNPGALKTSLDISVDGTIPRSLVKCSVL